MTYKLKMLGLALIAVLALTAVSAPTASATSYTASTYPTTGTAESALGNDIIHTEGGNVECKSHFAGTMTAASSVLAITPTYTECRGFGFLTATETGCKFAFTEPTGSADSYSANFDFTSTCTIVTPTCEAKIEPQTGLSSVALTNDTAAGDMTVKINVTGIVYNVTKDGLGCPFNGTGVKKGASYTQVNPVTFDAVSPSTASIDVA
jgi:hypothetical protein